MKYTLICYKPNSDDYCMGCHMQSYSSDHKVFVCERDRLIKELIEIFKYNLVLRQGEYGWDLAVLGNGLVLYSNLEDVTEDHWADHDNETYTKDRHDIDTLITMCKLKAADILKEEQLAGERARAEEKRIKKEKEAAAKVERESRKEADEIARLKELAEKYPDVLKK